MNNIKEYQEFINEEYNLKNLKFDINQRFSLAAAYVILKSLKYIIYFISIMKKDKDFGQYLRNDIIKKTNTILIEFKELTNKFKLINRSDIDQILKLKDKNEIINRVNDLKSNYEEKFNSSFTDDIKIFLLKTKNKKSLELYRKISDILNPIETKTNEIDPYGEDDWNDDLAKSINFFDLKRSFSNDEIEEFIKNKYKKKISHYSAEYTQAESDFFTEKLKELLLNKRITFIKRSVSDIRGSIGAFKTKIKVSDVKFVNNIDNEDVNTPLFELILKDNKGREYSASLKNDIKILD